MFSRGLNLIDIFNWIDYKQGSGGSGYFVAGEAMVVVIIWDWLHVVGIWLWFV